MGTARQVKHFVKKIQSGDRLCHANFSHIFGNVALFNARDQTWHLKIAISDINTSK
jgi:hypothetical protein